mmetsp:Transcript_11104/g.16350  ORF Transcript_11104/g.16350 Transcript_11104/m.16350 type:complete len:141 (-) Transcript_11104:263-685(-)|eukprot:CAMPEP_0113933680 /NCGR_PEP_ID=MMETSP1339-20121228/956_1 /TAXON_ID=94617 /ORGANISM="Fibrocapsa japonica" /LENGTH=140 /DNA_ID=CAMNT_0000935091 /DNA_START=121 /DNA_END=543 /DNA_ORIENTATION=+ /assembly_acc=CAM_ASM_000762
MATGVVADPGIADIFQEFKLRKQNRFIIFSVNDERTTIVITEQGPRDASWDDFCALMPENKCRYGLFDLEFTTNDNRPTSKLVFIAWSPDSCGIREKMIYAGSKEAIKSQLDGVGVFLTATDPSELDHDSTVLPAVSRFG